MFDLGLIPGCKYKVCGESMETESTDTLIRPRFSTRGPITSTPSGWGQPRLWANESLSDQPGPSSALLRKKPKYESRTIPYTSLATDSSGRNICIDSIIANVYIRIPDDKVSTKTILSELGSKISAEENELVLLDSKFVPVTDDDEKGKGLKFLFIM